MPVCKRAFYGVSKIVGSFNASKKDDRGFFEIKSLKIHEVQERLVSTLKHMQVPNGTGPSVRRSNHPLSIQGFANSDHVDSKLQGVIW